MNVLGALLKTSLNMKVHPLHKCSRESLKAFFSVSDTLFIHFLNWRFEVAFNFFQTFPVIFQTATLQYAWKNSQTSSSHNLSLNSWQLSGNVSQNRENLIFISLVFSSYFISCRFMFRTTISCGFNLSRAEFH